jgi:putative transposase
VVIVGVKELVQKELVAVEDGFWLSSASWEEVLIKFLLGFGNAVSKTYPDCRHQRCWVHETTNVLDKV